MAANISIYNADFPGEGLNDLTPASPVPGNTGTTIGQQRLKVFQAAADHWAAFLNNTQPILVYAQMNPLSCNPRSGIVGSAGATTAARDFNNAPRAATFYPIALAQELAGTSMINYPEIVAEFNSDIGRSFCLSGVSWWYGLSGSAPQGAISFYDTVLHEIAHGLGMYTYVDGNGIRATTTDNLRWDDHYMIHLMDNNTLKSWGSMTSSERAISSINGALVWNGTSANAVNSVLTQGTTNGRVHMYAPNSYQEGSSVSHWDIGLSPDELMEPYITATSIDQLTKGLFCDIGWSSAACPTPVSNTPEPASPAEDETVEKPFIYRMLNTLLPAINSGE